MSLKTIIPLTDEEKELYSKLDFKYFLDIHIKTQKISDENIKLIYSGYNSILEKHKNIENKTQHHLFIEGYIRKMHAGGMLPAHFNLSEGKAFYIYGFEDYGKDWAYFEMWAKRQKFKEGKKKFWKTVFDIGSILGYVLLLVQLLQYFAMDGQKP